MGLGMMMETLRFSSCSSTHRGREVREEPRTRQGLPHPPPSPLPPPHLLAREAEDAARDLRRVRDVAEVRRGRRDDDGTRRLARKQVRLGRVVERRVARRLVRAVAEAVGRHALRHLVQPDRLHLHLVGLVDVVDSLRRERRGAEGRHETMGRGGRQAEGRAAGSGTSVRGWRSPWR